MTTKKLTLKKVESLLEKEYDLVYIDYRDSLDDNPKEIQQAIHDQDVYTLLETINDDWIWESQSYSANQILEELRKSLETEYTENQLEKFFSNDDNMEELRNKIFKLLISINMNTKKICKSILSNHVKKGHYSIINNRESKQLINL